MSIRTFASWVIGCQSRTTYSRQESFAAVSPLRRWTRPGSERWRFSAEECYDWPPATVSVERPSVQPPRLGAKKMRMRTERRGPPCSSLRAVMSTSSSPDTGIQSLPNELVERILDGLDLQELLAAMIVDRRWRGAALAHRTYWHSVSLNSTRISAISLFTARLAYGGSRPVNVSIDVPWSWPFFRGNMVPIIAAHLHRMERLVLCIDATNAPAAFRALRGQAPALRSFKLRLVDAAVTHSLPSDVFSDTAPHLTLLELENVHLTRDAYPAFSAVEHVALGFKGWSPTTAVPYVFETFPSMRILELIGSARISDPRYRERDQWARVQALVLAVNVECR